MLLNRILIGAGCAAVLAASTVSGELIAQPSSALGSVPEHGDARGTTPLETASACTATPRLAPGPPTWWPSRPPCWTAAMPAEPHRDRAPRWPRVAVVMGVALLAAVALGTGGIAARRRRPSTTSAGRP